VYRAAKLYRELIPEIPWSRNRFERRGKLDAQPDFVVLASAARAAEQMLRDAARFARGKLAQAVGGQLFLDVVLRHI
jgi:hypothetical protein